MTTCPESANFLHHALDHSISLADADQLISEHLLCNHLNLNIYLPLIKKFHVKLAYLLISNNTISDTCDQCRLIDAALEFLRESAEPSDIQTATRLIQHSIDLGRQYTIAPSSIYHHIISIHAQSPHITAFLNLPPFTQSSVQTLVHMAYNHPNPRHTFHLISMCAHPSSLFYLTAFIMQRADPLVEPYIPQLIAKAVFTCCIQYTHPAITDELKFNIHTAHNTTHCTSPAERLIYCLWLETDPSSKFTTHYFKHLVASSKTEARLFVAVFYDPARPLPPSIAHLLPDKPPPLITPTTVVPPQSVQSLAEIQQAVQQT